MGIPDLQATLDDSSSGIPGDSLRTFKTKFNRHTHPESNLTSFLLLKNLSSSTFDVITSDRQESIKDAELVSVSPSLLTVNKTANLTDNFAVLVINNNQIIVGVSVTQGSKNISLNPIQSTITVTERNILRSRTISGILQSPSHRVLFPILMNLGWVSKAQSITVYASSGKAELDLIIDNTVVDSILADTTRVRTVNINQADSKCEIKPVSNIYLRSNTNLQGSHSLIHYSLNYIIL